MEISELLRLTVERNASDLHLVSSHSPTLRIRGELHPLVTLPVLTSSQIEELLLAILDPVQKERLTGNKELDFSTVVSLPNGSVARFRVNSYYQMRTLAASFRLIPENIKTIEELHLPSILHDFAKLRQGFILLTGPTGQGKSTTLASIIAEINTSRAAHIVTIEDPVEYVYPKKKAIVSQREMNEDTHSFANALKSVLREDPDVVYIGEMRDYETIASALTIAETGHLVFSTLHTNSAAQTIDRIIDIFPPGARDQVRMQLSMVISGIVTQKLLPSVSGERIPVCEILIASPSVKNTIREGNVHQIDNIIQTSKDFGMLLFEDHLQQLVREGTIEHEVALEYALRPEMYLQFMQR